MNRAEVVMDGVLAQLTDGIFTSATQLRGFRDHETIQASDLPFVQAFQPVFSGETEEFREVPTALDFQLELIDAPGRQDALREVIETLTTELHQDTAYANSLGAARIQVQLRDVRETVENELTIAGAQVQVSFADPGSGPGDVDLVSFADPADFSSAEAERTNSVLIPGGIGIRKTVSSFGVNVNFTAVNGGNPLDLSGTQFLRFLYYMRPELQAADIFELTILLFDIGGGNDSFSHGGITGGNPIGLNAGWNELVIDLSTGSEPLQTVVAVRFNMRYNTPGVAATQENLVMKRLYYKASDAVDAFQPAVLAHDTFTSLQVILDKIAQMNYGAVRQIGYTDPETINDPAQMPFVMVFQPSLEIEESGFGERPSQVNVLLQVIDVPGQEDSIRVMLEDLADELRINPLSQNDINDDSKTWRFRVDRHAVDERFDGETAIGSAEISISWLDPDPHEGDVDILPVADAVTGDFNSNDDLIPGLFAQASIISGGIGCRRIVTSGDSFLEFPGGVPVWGYPHDLSGTSTLRVVYYTRGNDVSDVGAADRIEVELRSDFVSGNPDTFNVSSYYFNESTAGWTEFAVDLANPDIDGGINLAAVDQVTIRRRYMDETTTHNAEAWIIKRVFYRAGDTLAVIPPSTAARTQAAMQDVLDRLSQISGASAASTRLSFTLPETIEEDLPFVQAYNGQTTTDDEGFRQTPNTLSFGLDWIDAPDSADAVRAGVASLANDLREDTTLGGDSNRSIRLFTGQLFERTESETTIARMEIRVQWNDSTTRNSETDVIDLAGNANLCTSTQTDIITDSLIIPGGIAWQRNSAFFILGLNFLSFPEYPIDLTGVKRLRILYYNRENQVTDTALPDQNAGNFQIQLGDGVNTNAYAQHLEFTAGWHEYAVDLLNPDTNNGADLSAVTIISAVWVTFTPFHTDEAVIFKRIYYTERDTGSLSNGRSF